MSKQGVSIEVQALLNHAHSMSTYLPKIIVYLDTLIAPRCTQLQNVHEVIKTANENMLARNALHSRPCYS